MIYLLHGENEFLKQEASFKLTGDDIPRHDGAELDLAGLRDLLFGVSLFGGDETVVIKGLSDNADLWQRLPDILENIDKSLILLENKLDKRTKTYKWLQRHAETKEFGLFTDKNRGELVRWLGEYAGREKVVINREQAEFIIDRLGYDQLVLSNFVKQLRYAERIDDDFLASMLPMAKSESAFELFEASLQGNLAKIHEIIEFLKQETGDDGAYMTLGLITSQATSLLALILAGGDQARVVSDLRIHPFALKKLAPYAREVTRGQINLIVQELATADLRLKTTSNASWAVLESALMVMGKK